MTRIEQIMQILKAHSMWQAIEWKAQEIAEVRLSWFAHLSNEQIVKMVLYNFGIKS